MLYASQCRSIEALFMSQKCFTGRLSIALRPKYMYYPDLLKVIEYHIYISIFNSIFFFHEIGLKLPATKK